MFSQKNGRSWAILFHKRNLFLSFSVPLFDVATVFNRNRDDHYNICDSLCAGLPTATQYIPRGQFKTGHRSVQGRR